MSSSSFENNAKPVADRPNESNVESTNLAQAVSLEERQELFAQGQSGKDKDSVINQDGTIDFGDPAALYGNAVNSAKPENIEKTCLRDESDYGLDRGENLTQCSESRGSTIEREPSAVVAHESRSRRNAAIEQKEVDLFKDGSAFDRSVLFDMLLSHSLPLTREPLAISPAAGLDEARVAQFNEYLQQKAAFKEQASREKAKAEGQDIEQFVDRVSEQWYQEQSLTGPAKRFCQELSREGLEEGGVAGISKDAAGMAMNIALEFSGVPELERSTLKIMADTFKGMPEQQIELDRLQLGLSVANIMPTMALARIAGKIATKSGPIEVGSALLRASKNTADDIGGAARQFGKMDEAAVPKALGAGALDDAHFLSKVSDDVPAWGTRFRYDKMPDKFPAIGDGKDTYIYLRKDQINQILEKGSLDGTAKGRAFGTNSPDIKDDLRSKLKTGVSDLKDRQYRIKITGDAANCFGDITPTGPLTTYKAVAGQRTSVAPGYDFKFDPTKIKVSKDGLNIEISEGFLQKMEPDRYARAVAKDTGSLAGNMAGNLAIRGTRLEASNGGRGTATVVDWLLDGSSGNNKDHKESSSDNALDPRFFH
ncbi:MAG: hypothetical protein IT342_20295 [Candidatus Melainabacteria bacterium]|nr:hypothetical protein [Candidatus Melainabacteria bacterium]